MTEAFTDEWWLDFCYVVARGSRDPRTQNGAILTTVNGKPGEFIAGGRNDVPSDIEVLPEMFVSPEKYLWVEHAERAAIFQAVRYGYQV